jgi:hypothetical protein
MQIITKTQIVMPANKKRKKPAPQPEMSGYKHFLYELCELLSIIDIKQKLSDVSNETRRIMYDFKITIRNPEAGNESITSKELKLISEKVKNYYHERTFAIGDKLISSHHLQLLYAYLFGRAKEVEKKSGNEHPNAIALHKAGTNLSEHFFSRLLLEYFRVLTQLNNPDQKYYAMYIHPAPRPKGKPKMVVSCEIFIVPARKSSVMINGLRRPAFQLGRVTNILEKLVDWVSVDVSLLYHFYKGNKKELDIFIQSHALSRLRERLDLLDQEAINYALWENTHTIKQFETYNGYLLLPFKVFDIKIGYLVANVTDDKLLFRTFLFITHNSSPEGTRLRKITGLGKEDITYWHIDRLSTFVNLKEEKYPGLISLFAKAGLGNLMELKNKEFTIDSMQAANLDGLTEYINRGKNEFNLMNLDLDTMVNEMEEEKIL